MSAASLWKYAYCAYFSQPKPERPLYRLIRRRRPVRFVELGIGSTVRAVRLLQVAERYAAGRPLEYTGIDLFEARQEGQTLPLKDAYRQLKATSARLRLVPGEPYAALASAANLLTGTDLLLISADQDAASLAAAWFYVPRMLHAGSLVLREIRQPEGELCWQTVSRAEVDELAAVQQRSRQAGFRRRAA